VDLFIITEKKIDKNLASKIGDLVNREINIKSSNTLQFLNGLKKKDPLITEVILNHIVKGADKICDIVWLYETR
jgi:hypothetical protein